jgi:ABC-type nitrate/sulfonate/bicarbonate transport system substrate-binding protein
MKKIRFLSLILILMLSGVSCSESDITETPEAEQLLEVTLMLDWVPNTNHTGFFVAQEKGFYKEAGLEVEIIEPGEVYAEQAVIGGAADFGISFQEQVTLALGDDIPLVSIASIIQHNTSGFASRSVLGAQSPADWEGFLYGSFGSPFEEPTLRVLMECAGGDFAELEIVDTGFADPLALLDEEQTDLAWIFYAWQGKQAQLQEIHLNIVMMEDWFDCIPDYYTPVLITSEATIQDRPEMVSAFLEAVSKGYTYAMDHPEEAANILLSFAPELDEDLVRASQAWISPRYQADALRWGEQELKVWEDYANWMLLHGIISDPIDATSAFSNDFLP